MQVIKEFMKAYLNKPLNVIILFFGTLLGSAALFTLVEGKPFVDALWWAVVTSSTVGFGDIYPSTMVGRFLAGMLLMFMSNFLITPLITAKMAAEFIVNSDAFTHEEQEELKNLLRKSVAGQEAAVTRELETQALLTEVSSLLKSNNFTTEEQQEVISLLREVAGELDEAVPLLKQIQSQTDELEDHLGVGDDE